MNMNGIVSILSVWLVRTPSMCRNIADGYVEILIDKQLKREVEVSDPLSDERTSHLTCWEV